MKRDSEETRRIIIGSALHNVNISIEEYLDEKTDQIHNRFDQSDTLNQFFQLQGEKIAINSIRSFFSECIREYLESLDGEDEK